MGAADASASAVFPRAQRSKNCHAAWVGSLAAPSEDAAIQTATVATHRRNRSVRLPVFVELRGSDIGNRLTEGLLVKSFIA